MSDVEGTNPSSSSPTAAVPRGLSPVPGNSNSSGDSSRHHHGQDTCNSADSTCAWCGVNGVVRGGTGELGANPGDSIDGAADDQMTPDAVEKLSFCSRTCLSRYKMHLFCTETQRYLHKLQETTGESPPAAVTASKSGDERILITPELWSRDAATGNDNCFNVDPSRLPADSASPSRISWTTDPPKRRCDSVDEKGSPKVRSSRPESHVGIKRHTSIDDVDGRGAKHAATIAHKSPSFHSPTASYGSSAYAAGHRAASTCSSAANDDGSLSGSSNGLRRPKERRGEISPETARSVFASKSVGATVPPMMTSVKSERASSVELASNGLNDNGGGVGRGYWPFSAAAASCNPLAADSFVSPGSVPVRTPLAAHPPPNFFPNPFAGIWPPSGILHRPPPAPFMMPGLNGAPSWPGFSPPGIHHAPGATVLLPYPVPLPVPIPLPIPIPVPIPPSVVIRNGKLDMDSLLSSYVRNQEAGAPGAAAASNGPHNGDRRPAAEPWGAPNNQRPAKPAHHDERSSSSSNNSVTSSSELGAVLDLSASRTTTTPVDVKSTVPTQGLLRDRRGSSDDDRPGPLLTQYFIDRLVAPPYLARRSLILDAPQPVDKTDSGGKLQADSGSSSGSRLAAAHSFASSNKKFAHHNHHRRRLSATLLKTKCIK